MSQLRVSSIASNAGTQSVTQDRLYRGAATAWVNFNGTGTVAIRDSYNVSSITDNGTGDYTVNFTTALTNANYSVTFGVVPDAAFSGSNAARTSFINTQSTAGVRVQTGYQAGSGGSGTLDFSVITVAIFGGY